MSLFVGTSPPEKRRKLFSQWLPLKKHQRIQRFPQKRVTHPFWENSHAPKNKSKRSKIQPNWPPLPPSESPVPGIHHPIPPGGTTHRFQGLQQPLGEDALLNTKLHKDLQLKFLRHLVDWKTSLNPRVEGCELVPQMAQGHIRYKCTPLEGAGITLVICMTFHFEVVPRWYQRSEQFPRWYKKLSRSRNRKAQKGTSFPLVFVQTNYKEGTEP